MKIIIVALVLLGILGALAKCAGISPRETFEQEKARKNAALTPEWHREREWHKWFAWYPVGVYECGSAEEGGFPFDAPRKAWLVTVEKRLGFYDYEEQPNWFAWDIRHFTYRTVCAATSNPSVKDA